MTSVVPVAPVAPGGDNASSRQGALLVFGAALAWSFGGATARALETTDPWTIVAWRSMFAALFLISFMVWRDGVKGTAGLMTGMRLPGFAVAFCTAAASISFVVALQHTTVANILLIQAGVPLIAALLGVVFLKERVSGPTWAAIAAVIAGIAIMVSDSFEASVSPIGDLLALNIAVVFAASTVITRRYSDVRMTPAVTLGVLGAAVVGITLSSGLAVSLPDLGLLFLFGALNLGLGMAMFVTGARMIPSALAALISTMEPVMGPIWVWLTHGETPVARTLIGGAVVFAALVFHILHQLLRRQPR